jgi:hypothetical protein
VTVTEKDPIWTELDDRLVAANNILSLSKIGEVECSIHEIIPGANAVWIMDDGLDVTEYLQAILINSQDLEALREGGLDSLVMLHLFKNF